MSQKSVNFHVKSEDYFGTLATILSLIQEKGENNKNDAIIMNNVTKDLMFLQDKFKILKK